MGKLTRKDVLQAVRRLVRQNPGLSLREFARHSKIPEHQVYGLFPGGGGSKVRRKG